METVEPFAPLSTALMRVTQRFDLPAVPLLTVPLVDHSPAAIAKASKSNLAFALGCLPKQRRKDMIVLYAFCREVDDIADDLNMPPEQKREGLQAWREGVLHGFSNPTVLQREISLLPEKYPINRELLADLVRGMEMDLQPRFFQTMDDLLVYCYHAASVVGLASVEIFGYRNERCREYAVQLGYALQLTNIMRDVGEDLDNGRVYLPLQDMAASGYTLEDLNARRQNEGFRKLMERMYQRTIQCHARAIEHLPEEDRRSMLSAEMMGQVYQEILIKMRDDGFRVFERRYKLSKMRMLVILLGHLLKSRWGFV